jgi:ferredoxin-thioredoxin reductase catalytic subunit
MKVKVNNNAELVAEIRQKLKENDGYCPCRIDKTPENKCMCQEFINQQETGECHCGLYIKEEV